MIKRSICLVKQISLLEIISTATVLLAMVWNLLESSMLLAKLHFKLPTGAHLLLMEYQLYQLYFQHTPLEIWITW